MTIRTRLSPVRSVARLVVTMLFFAVAVGGVPASSIAFDWEDAFDTDDLTPRQLEAFDRYLDDHPQVAQDLRVQPRLATNPRYLADHPGLRRFLADHPGVRRELEDDPRGIMREVEQYRLRDRRRERDHRRTAEVTESDIRAFDRFLDNHPNVRHDLRGDPWLAQSRRYLRNHDSFADFLDDHRAIRGELAENPRALLNRVDRYHKSHHKPPPKKKKKR